MKKEKVLFTYVCVYEFTIYCLTNLSSRIRSGPGRASFNTSDCFLLSLTNIYNIIVAVSSIRYRQNRVAFSNSIVSKPTHRPSNYEGHQQIRRQRAWHTIHSSEAISC